MHETIQPISVLIELRNTRGHFAICELNKKYISHTAERSSRKHLSNVGGTNNRNLLPRSSYMQRAVGCADSAIAEKEPLYKEDINQGRVGEHPEKLYQ